MLAMESWPPAYQPNHPRTKARVATRTRVKVRRERVQKILEQENDGDRHQQQPKDCDIDLLFAPGLNPQWHRRRQHVAFRELVGHGHFDRHRATVGVLARNHQDDIKGRKRVQPSVRRETK